MKKRRRPRSREDTERRRRPNEHLVEVRSIDGGTWTPFAIGSQEQCERAAARFRALFDTEARVLPPEKKG